MVRQLMLALIIIAFLGAAQALPDQKKREPQLVALTTNTLVEVEMNLQTAQESLFVPYCEKRNNRKEYLCTGAARIEVETRHGWQPAKLRTRDATLGGFNPKGGAPGRVIPPGGGATFTFVFSKDLFAVEHGQPLRVVLDTWPDEEAMKAGDEPIRLVSPPFDCP